jgi:uncharacterized protein YndB with AHSA1/START domain
MSTSSAMENCNVTITQEIHVKASLENTFAALLEQLGPENETPERKMPMKIEAWPGGRWFRDLGDNNGHLWGHVQAIKRPTLFEVSGPLFMSYAVANNLQYRLSEENGGTLIRFHHKAFGVIPEQDRKGMNEGWQKMNANIKTRAEKPRK